jgi:arylsulfatase A-like enzyme
LDLLPTLTKLAGGEPPTDRVLDGVDISPVLLGAGPSPRKLMFYYRDTQLYAVRKGPFKAHLVTRSSYGKDKPVKHDPPLVYHLGHDPSEQYNVADKYPDVVADLLKEVELHRAGMKPAKSQLDEILSAN